MESSVTRGSELGVVLIWLSGNDCYPHPRRPLEHVASPEHVEQHVLQVTKTLRGGRIAIQYATPQTGPRQTTTSQYTSISRPSQRAVPTTHQPP